MGKYMKKAKAAGDLSVMEVPSGDSGGGGVRTRAARAAAAAAADLAKSGASYLQLRSRLLIKKPNSALVRSTVARRRRRRNKGKEEREEEGKKEDSKGSDFEGKKECGGAGVGVGVNGEASCGDNVLEVEGIERSTRESTPCSLIRDPDGMRTPSSTTRPTSLTQTNRRVQSADCRHIPSTHEMEEFFTRSACAEEEERKRFVAKYNFDPLNEKPLPGRFEWEKLDP